MHPTYIYDNVATIARQWHNQKPRPSSTYVPLWSVPTSSKLVPQSHSLWCVWCLGTQLVCQPWFYSIWVVRKCLRCPWKCCCCNSINCHLPTTHLFYRCKQQLLYAGRNTWWRFWVYVFHNTPTKQFTPKTHSSPTVLLTDAELSELSQSDVLTPDASLPLSIRHSRGSRLSSSMSNQVPGNLRIGVVNINIMRRKIVELAELVNST